MARRMRVDPRTTTVARPNKAKREYVKRYERNPGHPPAEGYMINGRLHVYDGRHRRQAAINTRRKLAVDVYSSHEDFARNSRYARGDACCFHQLAKGKPRLTYRLAQRWIKMQVGLLAVPVPA